MRSCTICMSLMGLFVLAFLFGVAVAEDKPQAQPAASDETPPAGTADADKMMAEWMKMNQPGPQHELLKKLEGKWKAEVTMKMAPDGPEQKSQGTDTSEMILADHYLKSEFAGEMMGHPFKGVSLMGHDNLKKKYVSLWIDEMTTGFMTSEGTADSSGKVLTFTGECPDPLSGGNKQFRHVFTIENDDKHTFDAYMPGPDGKEFLSMQIVYTREK